jgi:hypothetical protein
VRNEGNLVGLSLKITADEGGKLLIKRSTWKLVILKNNPNNRGNRVKFNRRQETLRMAL